MSFDAGIAPRGVFFGFASVGPFFTLLAQLSICWYSGEERVIFVFVTR